MPTPVGHTLMGYILYSERKKELSYKDLVIVLLVANLPDIDLLPGFFMGNPNKFHHGMTHSLTFAVLTGLVIGAFYYIKQHRGFVKYSIFFFITYFSHLLLDFFGKDTKYPFGEQLFWPFSKIYVMSPIAIFRDVHKASSSDIFIQSLISWHNLGTIIVEIAILLPVLYWIKKRSISGMEN